MEKYCDCCQLGQPDWQTEQRETTETWFKTWTFTQRLCLDCLIDKWVTVGKGNLLGMRYKRHGLNVMWNTKGEM